MNETKENSSLPEGWRWMKLGEVATYLNGRAFKPTEWKNNGKPIIRIQNLNKPQAQYNYTKEEFEERYKIIKGDLLFAWSASLGAYIWKGDEAWLNQHIFKVVPNESTDKFYLFYLLKKIVQELYAKAHGSGMVHVTKGKFESTKVPFPPKPIQQAIVSKIEELFSELDKSIETLRLAQQQLKTYRQAVLKWAFEGKLTEEWRKENRTLVQIQSVSQKKTQVIPSGFELEFIAAEPLTDYQKKINYNLNEHKLPMEWRWVELSKVCEIKRGKSKHRPRNEPALYGGIYPFIQTGDIRNSSGKHITEYTQTYSELGLQQSRLWPKGTLCITIAANIGETAILGFDACFPDSVVGLLCDEKQLLNKYANYFFISFKHKLEELAPATAQKNINVDILEKVIIPLAPIAEQYIVIEEIEIRLSVADKMDESITQSLQQAEALRQSILKKAFEGKLI